MQLVLYTAFLKQLQSQYQLDAFFSPRNTRARWLRYFTSLHWAYAQLGVGQTEIEAVNLQEKKREISQIPHGVENKICHEFGNLKSWKD